MLSGGKFISTGNQIPANTCVRVQNTSPGFVPETSNNGVLYPSQKPIENALVYQNTGAVIVQSCPTATTAMLIKKPESMSTSLISTTTGPVGTNGNAGRGIHVNNLTDFNRLKPQAGFTASTQTDTIMSEKALEGDSQTENMSIINRYRNVPRIDSLPTIPVAKNVNDLLLLKSNQSNELKPVNNEPATEITSSNNDKSTEVVVNDVEMKEEVEAKEENVETERKRPNERRRRRVLRNVRLNKDTDTEITFSEPEVSYSDAEENQRLFKSVSSEKFSDPNKSKIYKSKSRVIYQLGSEPITVSDTISIFETASLFSLPKNEILDHKSDIEKLNKETKEATVEASPKIKEAIEVCSFSKENEEALKELGLDSDMDVTRSEGDTDSPKTGGLKPDEESDPASKKAKMKEEVDNVLREMPVRRIPNLYRRTECLSKNRLDIKSPLVVKNNDFLSKSPAKPPTVIDKLLEKNKSLKKAEQEGKFQNSVRNLTENFEEFDKTELKHKRTVRARKFTQGGRAHKKFANESPSCKIFERRGSNPEIYSNNYLNSENQVANENLPLRRVTDPGESRDKYQRRGSIDYDNIQKVIERRCSLPNEDSTKIPSKNAEDVNKVKTDNIKTIVVGSSSMLSPKSRGMDNQPRIINIVTSDDGSKKGQNLMEEINLEMESCYVNGDKGERRISIESCNSETENMKKLMDGLNDDKLSKEVPYCEEKISRKVEKLKGDRKCVDKEQKSAMDETPEDLATKETILSALGWYYLIFSI